VEVLWALVDQRMRLGRTPLARLQPVSHLDISHCSDLGEANQPPCSVRSLLLAPSGVPALLSAPLG
jgi:hypothetical protein